MKKVLLFFLLLTKIAFCYDIKLEYSYFNLENKNIRNKIALTKNNVFKNVINVEDSIKLKFTERDRNNKFFKASYYIYKDNYKFGFEYGFYKFLINKKIQMSNDYLVLTDIYLQDKKNMKNTLGFKLKTNQVNKKQDTIFVLNFKNNLILNENNNLTIEPKIHISKVDNLVYKLDLNYKRKINQKIFYNLKINSQFSKDNKIKNIYNKLSIFDEDNLRIYEGKLSKNGSFIYNDLNLNLYKNTNLMLMFDYDTIQNRKYLGTGFKYNYKRINMSTSYIKEYRYDSNVDYIDSLYFNTGITF